MDAEAAVASRMEAFLRAVLRNTRVSLAGLAVVVIADTVAGPARLRVVLYGVGVVVCIAGFVVCQRFKGRGCLVGILSLAISAWSGLVALLLSPFLLM